MIETVHSMHDAWLLPCTMCLQDRTPNVRFNAAKVMQQLATVSDGPAILHTIKPCLVELSADGDADVRFYAAAAAAACQ